uniref:Uncharacterized protein n=1 Tax=Triticum urartu TaxID=4572 RepID=A0A8R7UKR1_TRIUA
AVGTPSRGRGRCCGRRRPATGSRRGGGRGLGGLGALVAAAAAPDGDVAERAAAGPVASAGLAEVTGLREGVVVEVAELGVGGLAARALEPRLRLRDLGHPRSVRHRPWPHHRAARWTSAGTTTTTTCAAQSNRTTHAVRPRSHQRPGRRHGRPQLVVL